MSAETDDRRVEIYSMSCLGDKLRLYLTEQGETWITFEEEDHAQNACFSREQMLRLKDWLNRVQP